MNIKELMSSFQGDKNSQKKKRKQAPYEKHRISSNKSLGTNKYTPACSKKVSFWLSWNDSEQQTH
jgi:hypothetical protein